MVGDVCAQEGSFYERLGGRLKDKAAADDIVPHVSSDSSSRSSFDGVALEPLKAKVAEHLCSISLAFSLELYSRKRLRKFAGQAMG